MNKVTIKGKPFDLVGESKVEIGEKLVFKGIDQDGNVVNIADIKGKKVISIFPAIDTSVCSLQTVKISELAREKQDVSFISITVDGIDVIKKWCGAHNISNISILSDAKYGEFAAATNLMIKGKNLLARGLIVLDENNKITAMSFKEEITDMPDFDII